MADAGMAAEQPPAPQQPAAAEAQPAAAAAAGGGVPATGEEPRKRELEEGCETIAIKVRRCLDG